MKKFNFFSELIIEKRYYFMSEAIFNELSKIQGFSNLEQEAQDFFKEVCEQQKSETKTILHFSLLMMMLF